jgi:hippurate hydrolase
MKALRRDIHAHPDLGFQEERTSHIIAAQLSEFGCDEVHRGIGRTGVVGVIRSGQSVHTIGLRADMDALPIQEENTFAHRSTRDGSMHACGHDGHTVMLLSAARHLAASRNFDGTVHLIFQPAEEGLGGATSMLDDGLFRRFPCDAVFGMHNMTGLPVGKFSIRPGPMMAGGAFFDITITGRGAHGARPHLSVDPVFIACQITTALQGIISRNVDAAEAAVLSVTRISGGDAYNVIPEKAIIGGTVRAFKPDTMQLIEANMRRVAKGVADAFGATVSMDFRLQFVPLVNHAAETAFIADVAASIVGEENVERDRALVMASEDFGFMLQACPGAFIFIGNASADGTGSSPVHTPTYDFNDDALPLGAALYVKLAETRLARTT